MTDRWNTQTFYGTFYFNFVLLKRKPGVVITVRHSRTGERVGKMATMHSAEELTAEINFKEKVV